MLLRFELSPTYRNVLLEKNLYLNKLIKFRGFKQYSYQNQNYQKMFKSSYFYIEIPDTDNSFLFSLFFSKYA